MNCPRCGYELVHKYGIYGQFLGCSNYPLCNFTANIDGSETKRHRVITEWDENGKPSAYGFIPIIEQKPKQKCPYNKCNGTGLIPFIKDGKVVPNTFIYCECRQEHPFIGARKPEDFDFPMSYDWYRFLCQEHGWQDPGPDYPAPERIREVIIERQPANLQHISADMMHIRNKLNEHLDIDKKKRKPKPRPTKRQLVSKYKGLNL